jgi:hypothetical protein
VRKKEKESTEFIPPKQEVREARKVNLKDLLGGSVLSREIVIRQIPFVLFLFAILLFYIGNQYRGDKVMKDIVDVEKRLKDLRTGAVSTAFELMEKSKQSEVIRIVREQGLPLEEAMIPPTTIEAK